MPNGHSYWYLDDGVLVGPAQEVMEAWNTLQKTLGEVDLRLNIPKCECWTPPGQTQLTVQLPTGISKCDAEGFELLGAPVGTEAFCVKVLRNRVERIKGMLTKLRILRDPQSEFALLRSCCGFAKFAFSLRTAPSSDILTVCTEFDRLLFQTCRERLGVQISREDEKQWALPIRMGGFGMFRASDAGPAAFIASCVQALAWTNPSSHETSTVLEFPGMQDTWELFRSTLGRKLPELHPTIVEFLGRMDLMEHRQRVGNMSELSLTTMLAVIPKSEPIQHFLTALRHEFNLHKWLALSPPSGNPARVLLRKLAVLRSDPVSGYVGNWLNVIPSQALGTKLEPAVFASLLRWWGGEPVSEPGKCPRIERGRDAMWSPLGRSRRPRRKLPNGSRTYCSSRCREQDLALDAEDVWFAD